MGREKNTGGRPTKFTEEIKTEILGYIENGNTYHDSCILSGVSESIFMEWKKKGREAREKGIDNGFSEFLERIECAETKYKAWLIQNVNSHTKKDGKLALEVLSRKWPKEYGKNETLTLNGKFDVMKFDVPISEEDREYAKKQLRLFLKKGFDPEEDYTNGQK